MGKVLLVEDSEDLRFALASVIRKEGHTVFEAENGSRAAEIIAKELIDLAFLDIGLPDMDGMSLIGMLRKGSPDTDIIMITGINDARTAVQSLKAGAADYLLKPFDIIEFRNILTRFMQERRHLKQSILAQREKGAEKLVGESEVMKRLRQEIATAAEVKAPVLITGETGTGKELVARAICGDSSGRGEVFVKVDCGTLSASIIESELFGHERGAFTDARRDKKGLVEIADGGTLFLDEIGTLPVELQPKLLRLIEEGTFRRVGGLRDINVSIRIIAATNIRIEDEIRAGRFREDLYYRLKVITLDVPPLRERGDDVLRLAYHYIGKFSRELNRPARGLTEEAKSLCLAYSWPGNVRELKNCIERAVIYCRGEWIEPVHLNLPAVPAGGEGGPDDFCTLEQMQQRYILKVLESVENNKSLAARILGISRTTLRERLKAINS